MNNLQLVYTADEENYDYSKTTYERDGWGGGEYVSNDNIRQNTVMNSDRVYVDENNIMRFMINENEKDFEKDFYCVAMSEGFETRAAEICGFENNQLHYGYTFYVELIDSNGEKHHMNVMKIDSKGFPNDPYNFTTHDNLIEFITAFDEKANGNSYGVKGPASDNGEEGYGNLDYDKLFNANDVRIYSISAYEDGWIAEGNYVVGYKIRSDINNIFNTDNNYADTDYSLVDILNTIDSTDMPESEKERIKKIIKTDIYNNIKFTKYSISQNVKKVLKTIKSTVTKASTARYDPLILDIDGDGFNIETKENGTNFDLDKNGFAEKINWTRKDGILCLDLNGNGKVDNGGEVFGDWTMLPDGARAKNGFEALAQYDSNEDGVIDANDEIFSQLRVWVDADGDGISGEGELKTLSELGIVSINLSYANVNAETGTEALIGNTATFTRADGTTGKAGELWVSTDLFDTEDRVDVEVSDEIAALPNVKSIGNVYSLHSAIALDETGELKALVESFISEEDADKRIAITEQILFFISGAKNIVANSRGEYIDARQLAVIEEMLGEKYVGTTGANPHSDAAPMLKSAYQDLLNMYYNELNAQTHIKDYAALLRYTENENGTKTLNADLVNFILEYQLEKGDENAKKMLTEVARYVKYLDNGGINGFNSFVMNYATISSEYAADIVKIMPNGYAADGENPLKGSNNVDFLVGSNNNDEIYGYSGNDILIGGKGNDNLYGSYGDDTYIFNLGDGNDIIEDSVDHDSNSKADKVIFGEGIFVEDIKVERSGDNMIVRYSENDSITLKDQYSKSYCWIENFEFADGTKRTINDFLDAAQTIHGSGVIVDYTSGYGNKSNTLVGSDGDDKLYGYGGSDTLIGGKGDDILYGSWDNDTYIFNLGDGNDIIEDYVDHDSNSKADKVIFGEGISAEDIIFSKQGKDLVISYGNYGDTVTVQNQYYFNCYEIERFETSDGYSISNTQVNLLIQSMAAFEADTGMSWAEAAEQSNEAYSDIISQMWVKSVS